MLFSGVYRSVTPLSVNECVDNVTMLHSTGIYGNYVCAYVVIQVLKG